MLVVPRFTGSSLIQLNPDLNKKLSETTITLYKVPGRSSIESPFIRATLIIVAVVGSIFTALACLFSEKARSFFAELFFGPPTSTLVIAHTIIYKKLPTLIIEEPVESEELAESEEPVEEVAANIEPITEDRLAIESVPATPEHTSVQWHSDWDAPHNTRPSSPASATPEQPALKWHADWHAEQPQPEPTQTSGQEASESDAAREAPSFPSVRRTGPLTEEEKNALPSNIRIWIARKPEETQRAAYETYVGDHCTTGVRPTRDNISQVN